MNESKSAFCWDEYFYQALNIAEDKFYTFAHKHLVNIGIYADTTGKYHLTRRKIYYNQHPWTGRIWDYLFGRTKRT